MADKCKPFWIREFPGKLKKELKGIAIEREMPLYRLVIEILQGYVAVKPSKEKGDN